MSGSGGFTFIELLVALAIVVIAMGLLLPALQRVREASNRTRCTNHLKQLGTAFHAYHDARGHFPKGGSTSHCPRTSDLGQRDADWTWAYHLLPHLEQNAVHKNPDPDFVCRVPIPVFNCPSRRPSTDNGHAARIDYAGNAGVTPDGANGVIVPAGHPPVRLADVPDGLGCTVCVGGKRLNRAELGQSDDDNDAYPVAGWTGDYEVYRVGTEPPMEDVFIPGDRSARSNFGAAHRGVFNAGFCDGSVRTLRYSVDPDAWRRACSRNDSIVSLPNDL